MRIVLKNDSKRIVIRSSGLRGPQGPAGPPGPPGSPPPSMTLLDANGLTWQLTIDTDGALSTIRTDAIGDTGLGEVFGALGILG